MITEDDALIREDLLHNKWIFSAQGYVNSNLDFKVNADIMMNRSTRLWFTRQYVK